MPKKKKEKTVIVAADLTSMTPKEKESFAEFALMMYSGEFCRFCDKQINDLEELKTVVFAGYHDKGRIAHKECWDAQPEEVKVSINESILLGR